MDTHGKIIALLHGDMQDHDQIRTLLAQLIESPKDLGTLLQQVDITQRLSRLSNTLSPAPLSVKNNLKERVNRHSMSLLPVMSLSESADTHSGTKSDTVPSPFIRRSLQLLAGLVLFAAGYLLGNQVIQGSHVEGPAILQNTISGADSVQSLKTESSRLLDTDTVHTTPQQEAIVADSRPNNHRTQPSDIASPQKIEPEEFGTLSSSSSTLSSALNILAPDGGEEFMPDITIPILWSGNPDSSPVSIAYSNNAGMTWENIVDSVTGERYLWNIPENIPPGNQYLLRVRPVTSSAEKSLSLAQTMQVEEEGITLDISPDGRYIATAGRALDVVIRDLTTGTVRTTMSGHSGSIQSCRYSADGSKIVTSALDGTAIVWDVASGEREHILDAGMDTLMWWAAFSPDGRTVATAQEDGIVILWDAVTGQMQSTLELHSKAVRYVEFTDDGGHLITASTDRTAVITDVNTGTVERIFLHHPVEERSRRTIVNGIQVTRDGAIAITAGHDGYVKFWNTTTGELIHEHHYTVQVNLDNGSDTTISSSIPMVLLSPDETYACILSSHGRMDLADPHTGAIIASWKVDTDENSNAIHLAFSPDSKSIGVSHTDGRVTVWEIAIEDKLSKGYWSISQKQ